MKTILYTVIPFIFCLFSLHQEKPQNVTAILHFDEELSQTEQTLYIASFCPWISGFEQNIWDSIQTQKGQKNVLLHAYAPIGGNSFRIIFSKEGPNELGIFAMPNDTVEIEVKHSDTGQNIIYKKALKGQNHNEWIESNNTGRKLWMKRRLLETENNADSLMNWDKKMIDYYREQINHTKNCLIATNSMTILRVYFKNILSADTIQALREQIARTFPDNPRASLNYGYNKTQTENGIFVAQRLNEISRARTKYKKTKQNTQIGKALNLNLYGIEGNKVALSDLTECQYIYVDIWASWCKPCRVQFPHIKEALEKYPKDLKVYAVSIDQNHSAWQKAIKKDPLKDFINVIGTDNEWKILKEVEDLGVERIPKSFLLDKNRRIIAKDLHDGRLLEVLDSLITK